tara:strand:+ start:25838 stop:26626 length:789 start_codon:yes stop_codon:yes gene_type:complete
MAAGNETYLDRIVAHHRKRVAADRRDVQHLSDLVDGCIPAKKFRNALAEPGLSVIAEVKRRSPSKGDLFPDLDPAVLAKQYFEGGAACLSVLTDGPHFGGSVQDLQDARSAVDLPVLRKDFTVDDIDVLDARLMGADAVLLIAAALSSAELKHLYLLGREIGLDVLVEVHDEGEMEAALEVGADLIGVNQRDLYTFKVDHERASRMAALLPAGVIGVAESGVRGPEDAAALKEVGYKAVLVGETLVTSGDPVAAVSALRGSH